MSENWFHGLNQAQYDAVTYDDGSLLVIAGPGTGKTRALTLRILYLIAKKDVRPDQILALTFTNKAAREIRDRVDFHLRGDGADVAAPINVISPWLGTFHAWALHFLRDELGSAVARPVDEDTAFQIFKDAAVAVGLDLSGIKGLFDAVMKAKEAGEVDLTDEKLKLASDAYRNAMQQRGLWDYADLLIEALRLLRFPDVKRRFRNRTHYILVDEFQDINDIQYAIIKEMALVAGDRVSDSPKVTAIGDPRQAIYGFRGADPVFIDRFIKDFSVKKTITLDIAYRCPQIFLDAAASVVGETKSGLKSAKGEGHKMTLKVFRDDLAEARWIAKTIEAMIGPMSLDSLNMLSAVAGSAINLSDVAVLFRINALSGIVERALKERGIPYKLKVMTDVAEVGPDDIKTISEVWDASEGVSLLSLHASKGLEFKAVFIIGCEDGILPWKNGDMAEEERLFYVGITRAAERLFLCVSKKRILCTSTDELRPSRFLSRIPAWLFATDSKDRPKKTVRPRQKGLF